MSISSSIDRRAGCSGLSAEDAIAQSPNLIRFAMKLTGSRQDAEDLLQDTLLRAHQRFDRWEPGTNLRGWLSTLMLNIFRTQWNVKRRRNEIGAAIEDIVIEVPSNQEAALSLSRVREHLPHLSPSHRLVIQLVMDGASYDETATRLNVPVGTVRSRLSRARSVLREGARVG
jgi:RNA polymerase sigma-70 factor (ECF subfamily)